ncbi:uncharacterized protein LOC129601153 [Paramacrobiotus metropolitanus]|uniref:uncharacterized protein LOC129601153 n=1 Tax=Paramacrobiotus metropolitanus TaxID=2943436 RepID=UPI002445DA4F|nr:uncharacterized protein LOC129601153 [Paramacrobiotus metropolitanus]
MNSILSVFVSLVALHNPLGYANPDNENGQFTPATPEEFPIFSTEPMSRDQCGLQFTANCQPNSTESLFTQTNCTAGQGLEMGCNASASVTEIYQLAVSLSQPPVRAVSLTLYDNEQLTFDTVAPVRKLSVVLNFYNCVSSRATAKLYELRLTNLQSFNINDCYGLVVKKTDFWQSLRLKMILFVNSTLQHLEPGTFTDLPGLRLLSMESYLDQMEVFNDQLRDYIKRLHCGCEYAWLRQFLNSNRLLGNVSDHDIYYIRTYSFWNSAMAKREIYLPIDCAAESFPLGNNSIDFTQERFSVNENSYANKWHEGCKNESSDADEAFPDFTLEVMTPEECAVQADIRCASNDTYVNCTLGAETGGYGILGIDCNNESALNRIKRLVVSIAKLPLRPIELDVSDQTAITSDDIAPVRRQIISYILENCTSPRASSKLRQLVLPNLLEYSIWHCSNLVVKRSDFQYSQKLRKIAFYNTTIRTLDENAFTTLPALRILSLEQAMWTLTPLDERLRGYLFRLHCSCEFAGFRRWWNNNTALLRSVAEGEVLNFAGGWQNLIYERTDVYLPVDCKSNYPKEKLDIAYNATSFSVHEPYCG